MDTIDFLRLHDYIIYVRSKQKNGVIVHFPENKDREMSSKDVSYFYYKNEIIVGDTVTKTIPVLDYEARPFITGMICLEATKFGIPPKYIVSLNDDDDQIKFYTFFQKPTSLSKEAELVTDLSNLLLSGQVDEDAKNLLSLNKFINAVKDN